MTPLEVYLRTRFLRRSIGDGCSRTAYAHPLCPGVVFKEPHYYGCEHNANEVRLWNFAKKFPTLLEPWLAPIVGHFVDNKKDILVMRRTSGEIAPYGPDFMSTTLPRWVNDFHHRNVGYYDGRVVCHDYAFYTKRRIFSWLLFNGIDDQTIEESLVDL